MVFNWSTLSDVYKDCPLFELANDLGFNGKLRSPEHLIGRLHHFLRAEVIESATVFDNYSSIHVSDLFGQHYGISIYANGKNTPSIHVWNHSGQDSVCTVYTKTLDEESIRTIAKAMEHYSCGEVQCAECGEWIKRHEAGGRYFAGLYCQHCWDTKWKEIEAKETYN
jgi:hypothetical protein